MFRVRFVRRQDARVQDAAVFIHSLAQFTSGGADTVINALLTAVGRKGTLCFPTLSYLFTSPDAPTFDVTIDSRAVRPFTRL
jgi:aminoglycoside N3'-acetyltransferase